MHDGLATDLDYLSQFPSFGKTGLFRTLGSIVAKTPVFCV
jgi:hypothetical protein